MCYHRLLGAYILISSTISFGAMYTNFKSPLFQKHDVTSLNTLLKESIQSCVDSPNSQALTILSRAFDYLTFAIVEPTLIEEVFRTAQPSLLTQIEMLTVRLNKWPQSEQRDQLLNSLKNFLKRLYTNTPKLLQPFVAKSKPPSFINDGPPNDINIVAYMADSTFYSEGPFVQSYQVLLRLFRIVLLHYDKARQEGSASIPDYLFFFQPAQKDAGSNGAKLWDKVIQSFLQVLNVPEYNQENQSRVLDILIFLQRDNNTLKQIIVEQGSLRVLMSKCSETAVSLEVALRTLLLVRDLCQGNWVTTDLVSRYETEKHLMKLMQRFRAEQELSNLISQILELLIKGYDLDLENLEKNLKLTYDRLQKYIASRNEELDPSKALSNVEVLRFYSLMAPYVKRIVEHKVETLLVELAAKENSLSVGQLASCDQDHLRLIIANNMVLERIVTLSDVFGDQKKLTALVQQIGTGIQVMNSLAKADSRRSGQSLHADCIFTYLSLLQAILSNEATKGGAAQLSRALNQQVLDAKNIWDDNQPLSKLINGVLFVLAKQSNDQADQIVRKLVIKDAMEKLNEAPQQQQPGQLKPQQLQQQTKSDPAPTREYTKRKQTLDFISTLSDLPQAVAQIIQSPEGLECIIAVLSQENQFMMALFPECAEDQVDERIYMLDLGLKEEVDQNDSLERILMKAEDPEALRKVLIDKKRLLVRTMEVLRKLLKNDTFKKQAVTEGMLKEVLGFLRIFSKERDQCILSLRILNTVAGDEKFQALLQENKGVESIFFALNDHPTDKDIQELAGNVLKQLGAEEIGKSVKDQFDDLGREFDVKDPESTNAIRQANIYLANLITAVPEEETPETIEENKRVIKNLAQFLVPGMSREVMGSIFLLISRLGQQGEETKRVLRHSDIPRRISQLVFLEKQVHLDRVTGFAVEAICNMIGGGSEMLNALDPLEGIEFEQETPELRQEYLVPLQGNFTKNNLRALEFVVNLLNKGVIGQATFAKLKGAAASVSNEDTSATLDSLYDNSSQRAVIALELIEKSSQLGSRFCRCDKQFLPLLVQMRAHEFALEVFRELGEPHLSVAVKAQVFQRSGAILAELARNDPAIFVQVCLEESVMSAMVDVLDRVKVDDVFANTITQMEQLQSVLKFLQAFLDNKFDKALVCKRQLPQKIGRLTRAFSEYYTSNLSTAKDNAFLGILTRDLLQVMYLILLDPLTAKEDRPEQFVPSLRRFLEASNKLPPRPIDGDDSDEVYGSDDAFVRIVESVLKVFEQASKDMRVCRYYNGLFSEDDTVLRAALYVFNNPYLVTKVLSIQKRLMLTLEDQQAEAFTARMVYLRKNLKEVQKQSVQQYPKVPCIARSFNELSKVALIQDAKQYELARNEAFGLMLNVKEVDLFQREMAVELQQFATASRVQVVEQSVVKDDAESIQQKKKRAAEGEVTAETAQVTMLVGFQDVSEIVHSLDRMSNAFEMFLQKSLDFTMLPLAQQKSLDKDWISALLKLIQAVKEYVQDNQTASKVHQIEITNSLLSFLMMDDLLDPRVNSAVIDCLAHISQFQEALKSYENKVHLYDPYVSYAHYLISVQDVVACKNFTPFFVLMKNAVALEEIQTKVIKQNQLQPLARILAHCIGNYAALTTGAECLDRYGFSERIAQIYYEEGAAKIILDQLPRNVKDASFTSAFCLLIGTLCRFQPAQALLSQNKIHQTIVGALNLFPNDVKLLSNAFYAISGLCFNNKSLAVEIIESPIVPIMKNLIAKQPQQPVLMETISSVVSNLTYRNDQNKVFLGQSGLVEQLVQVFAYYAFQHPEFRAKTLKQLLRALGNVGFLLENSTRLIQANFLRVSKQLIEQKLTGFQERGEVAKYTLDVYANLCSHPEEQNRANIEVILREGITDTVLNLLKKNILLGDVVLAGMDTLDGLVQGKVASQQVAEKGGVETIVKIIRSHDWNDVVVSKCFRLLANIGIVRQNAEMFVRGSVPLSVAESVRNLKVANPKLLTYAYKILHRIASGEKGRENLLYKCGFIEAINEILNKRGVYDNHLELIQLLNRVSQNDEALELVARKASNTILQRIPEEPRELAPTDQFIRESLYLLERIFSRAQFLELIDINAAIFVLQMPLQNTTFSVENKIQILKCLIAMNVQSERCRKLCQQHQLDRDIQLLRKTDKTPQLKQAADVALQAIYNNQQVPPESDPTMGPNINEQAKLLANGFPIKLYRADGSSKQAILQATPDLKELVAKQPDGVIKKKYHVALIDISFMQFNYTSGGNDWNTSVFAKCGQGMFSKKLTPDRCFTITGTIKSAEGIIQINGESNDQASKQQLERALKTVIHALKSGLIKVK